MKENAHSFKRRSEDLKRVKMNKTFFSHRNSEFLDYRKSRKRSLLQEILKKSWKLLTSLQFTKLKTIIVQNP